MDIEKILYLVALVVYGILSTVLSIVRTLKTSKISSEVKAVLPSIDDGKTVDDGKIIDDGKSIDIDGGQPADDVVKTLSFDDILELFSRISNNKK